MTKEVFIAKIQKHRKEAESLIEGNGGFKIKRGMAHVISGYVEDLFALFIAEAIGSKTIEYFVDKVTSIKFKPKERAKTFKPDLSIVNENVLTHYFDLKTNMGWNRHFEDYLKTKNDFIESLKGKKAWIHWQDGNQEINISKELKYQMVVVFGWNINQELLKTNLLKAQGFPNVEVHVLYVNKEDGDGYAINENAFDNIINSVKA